MGWRHCCRSLQACSLKVGCRYAHWPVSVQGMHVSIGGQHPTSSTHCKQPDTPGPSHLFIRCSARAKTSHVKPGSGISPMCPMLLRSTSTGLPIRDGTAGPCMLGRWLARRQIVPPAGSAQLHLVRDSFSCAASSAVPAGSTAGLPVSLPCAAAGSVLPLGLLQGC